MEVTPTPPQKRPTRGKSVTAETAAVPPKLTNVAVKPVRRGKAQAEQAESDTARASSPVAVDGVVEVTLDPTQRIATTAYFLAAARNFEPGHELEDWLEAERRIRAEG